MQPPQSTRSLRVRNPEPEYRFGVHPHGGGYEVIDARTGRPLTGCLDRSSALAEAHLANLTHGTHFVPAEPV